MDLPPAWRELTAARPPAADLELRGPGRGAVLPSRPDLLMVLPSGFGLVAVRPSAPGAVAVRPATLGLVAVGPSGLGLAAGLPCGPVVARPCGRSLAVGRVS